MNKCLVLFVEGETEVEFYRQVISEARKKRPNRRFNTYIETKCVKGVGNFKSEVLRKFQKVIVPHYGEDVKYTIVLCNDTDVFELSQHPGVVWEDVIEGLKSAGADNVIHIQAKHCIEDWFLLDIESIIAFLRLPKKTKVPSAPNGYEKLKRLYKLANKIYLKGMKSNGMISKMNIKKIVDNEEIKNELKPLYEALGVS